MAAAKIQPAGPVFQMGYKSITIDELRACYVRYDPPFQGPINAQEARLKPARKSHNSYPTNRLQWAEAAPHTYFRRPVLNRLIKHGIA